MSTLVPWIQAIAETLKRIRRKKSAAKVSLPLGETIIVNAKSFLCFTASPQYLGRQELPTNLKKFLRPINFVEMDKMPLLKVLLRSNGIQSSDELASLLVEQSTLCQDLLSTPKKLDMRRLLEVIYQMRQVKNEAAADQDDSHQADFNSKKILQELIEQRQSGSLPARDAVAAKEISLHTWQSSNSSAEQNSR